MSDAARTLLRDWLRRQLSEAQKAWLDAQHTALARETDDTTLHIALGMVPRRLGKADLELSAPDLRPPMRRFPGGIRAAGA